MNGQRGIALVAVLALLACVGMLALATLTQITMNWLSARNLREGTLAWSRVESVAAASVASLGEAFQRNGALPEDLTLTGIDQIETTVAYTRTSDSTAIVEVIGRFGQSAVRREIVVDMASTHL